MGKKWVKITNASNIKGNKMSNKGKNYSIAQVDSKNVCPTDYELINDYEVSKHYHKPTIGYAVITNNNTGEVIDTPNLVLLTGREFIAQKLADIGDTPIFPNVNNRDISPRDLFNYKIRYFGVGSGGASVANATSKIGPYDNDIDLIAPGTFGSCDTLNDPYKYIADGKLKHIYADNGNIEILSENHTISNEVTVPAMTTIKYTLIIESHELKAGDVPFSFNEAALYAVEYDPTTNEPKSPDLSDASKTGYQANYRPFARFTTATKILELPDSLKIEWFILT